jgi:tetratricopeptide (TPR) repeat protein
MEKLPDIQSEMVWLNQEFHFPKGKYILPGPLPIPEELSMKRVAAEDREDVDRLRLLAQEAPNEYNDPLAKALSNLGVSLSDLGRYEEAVQVTQEAVDIARKLYEKKCKSHEAQYLYACLLENSGIRLYEAKRYSESFSCCLTADMMFKKIHPKY